MTRRLIVPLAVLLVACGGGADSYDILIRGGSVLDGTGAPARVTDIGIRGDMIARIGDLSAASATREIDATGLVVSECYICIESNGSISCNGTLEIDLNLPIWNYLGSPVTCRLPTTIGIDVPC